MFDDQAKAKLRDPAYFALHIQAATAIREVDRLGWYDSQFLRRFEVARRYLAKVRPDALADFVAGFDRLKPPATFRETLIEEVFDPATREAILTVSRTAPATVNEEQSFEEAKFGREVVWDHPFFLDLQEQVRGMISDIIGQPLVPSYNFLSRYGAQGQCDLHMDHPDAMYTFDYCIEQDAVWPIHIGRVMDWPTAEFARDFDPARITSDPAFGFTDYLLRPNQALLFNGSSQWHYRRPKTAGGFCNLLFFHYVPAGCENLVVPHAWADEFAIPELGALCDLFADDKVDGLG